MAAYALREKLNETARRIQELKEGCCTKTRDCMFDDLIRFVMEIQESMGRGLPHQMTEEERRKIVRSGEVLGKLAVGCCRPERIQSYSECIALLNEILFKSFALYEKTDQT